jgi:hypothetical protein
VGRVSPRKSSELEPFRWVNTVIANATTAIRGTCLELIAKRYIFMTTATTSMSRAAALTLTLTFFNSILAAGPKAQGIDPFVPVDEVVSNSSIPITDPEFDENGGNWVAWQLGPNAQNPTGFLIVARVDPDTGDLLDWDTGLRLTEGGHGKVIDDGLVGREQTKNGPEWTSAAGGSRLLYTKFNENSELSIAQAVFDGGGWITGILPNGRNRFTPEGSKDPDDTEPRVAYFAFVNSPTPEVRLAIRLIDYPLTERVAPSRIGGATFIPGEAAILGTLLATDGYQQVVHWDYGAESLEQITFDYGAKQQTPEAWRAPELGNEPAFAVPVQFSTSGVGRVYAREIGTDGLPTWVQYMQFASPDPSKPFMGATRPFVYLGKSYICFKVQPTRGSNLGSDFYITDLEPDPTLRLMRKVSSDETIYRYDQEFYLTTHGPVIYYSEVTPAGINIIHRVQTGIMP